MRQGSIIISHHWLSSTNHAILEMVKSSDFEAGRLSKLPRGP